LVWLRFSSFRFEPTKQIPAQMLGCVSRRFKFDPSLLTDRPSSQNHKSWDNRPASLWIAQDFRVLLLQAEALASVPAARPPALDTKMPIISAASVPKTTIRRLNLRQKSRGFCPIASRPQFQTLF
jgi:hypothetical protein